MIDYQLYPHQVEGVKFLRSRPRAMLLDEMGAGKTAQAVMAVGKSPTIVVCPAMCKGVWEEEIPRWSTHDNWVITSYGTAHKHYDQNLGTMILDECTLIKNWTARRSKAVNNLAQKMKPARLWMLTGTPVMNNVGELHHLLQVLEPNKHGSKRWFLEKYSHTWVNDYGGLEYEGVKDEEGLRARISHLWLRRLKKDVLKDLPPLTRQFLEFEPPTDARAIEGALADEYGFLRYQHATYASKVGAVIDLCKGVDSFVVFVHHRDIAKRYGDELGATVVTGEETAEKRTKKLDAKPPKIVATIDSCGMGISFAHISRCIFAELEYIPAKLTQAEARLHRPGQHNPVNSYYLMTPLDIRVIQVLREKEYVVSAVMQEPIELGI